MKAFGKVVKDSKIIVYVVDKLGPDFGLIICTARAQRILRFDEFYHLMIH